MASSFFSMLFKGAETGLSAYNLWQQGKYAESAGSLNASVETQNAELQRQQAAWVRKRTELDVAQLERSMSVLMGRQRAGFAAAGIQADTGSAADVLIDTAKQAAIDIDLIRMQGEFDEHAAEVGAVQSENRATVERWTGQRAATGAKASAGGSILRGVTDMWDIWSKKG